MVEITEGAYGAAFVRVARADVAAAPLCFDWALDEGTFEVELALLETRGAALGESPNQGLSRAARWLQDNSNNSRNELCFTNYRRRSTTGSYPLPQPHRSWVGQWILAGYTLRLNFMNESKNAAAGQYGSTNYTAPSKNIVDTVIAGGNFTTLVAAIKAAGLTDKLTGKGPFTVFAPTDAAFKKLAPGALETLLKDCAKLKAVLSYRVVAGHVLAKDVKSGDVMTLQGSPLTASVSSSGVHVNGATSRRAISLRQMASSMSLIQ
jgi:uncharacterized surface protein with fasciclin (FAS1) repeats